MFNKKLQKPRANWKSCRKNSERKFGTFFCVGKDDGYLMSIDLYQNLYVRHKVFISYYHKEDQPYKEAFEKTFSQLFIHKSVQLGDISSDVSTEYIKQLIQKEYLSDSSVLIVLFGPNTVGRKHVDWEISAALSKKVGGYSGLIGIALPTLLLSNTGGIFHKDIPPRLLDNITSGYAKLYTWMQIYKTDGTMIKSAVEKAFQDRVNFANKIVNSRPQFVRNWGE